MKRAQSTLEFAIVIFAVVAALLAMQVYIRRGLQGKLRTSADEISIQQYEPGRTVSDLTVTQTSDISTVVETKETEDGAQYQTETTTTINDQTETREGTEKILPREQ